MANSFTVEDIRLLEKTISIRERLIDNLMKREELPTKPREIDSFTNLLESVDRSIFTKTKINIEDTQNKVNEETKEILRDLLLDLHKGNNRQPQTVTRDVPVFVPTTDIPSEGELIPKIDQTDVSKFLQEHAER
jgi:hypothetical protein